MNLKDYKVGSIIEWINTDSIRRDLIGAMGVIRKIDNIGGSTIRVEILVNSGVTKGEIISTSPSRYHKLISFPTNRNGANSG